LNEPKPYQSRDGEWRASLDVTANAVKFLGGRSEGGAPGIDEGPGAGIGDGLGEEDIPF
jgi:hypothetical protein